MNTQNDQPDFEDLLRQFDEAVTSLESDELSLAVAMDRYETAVSLAEQCARILTEAEIRITEIDRTLERIDDEAGDVDEG